MGKATVDKGEGKDDDNDNSYDNDGNDNNKNDQESIDPLSPYKEKVEDNSTKMPPTPLAAAAGKTAGKTAAAAAAAKKKKKDPTGVAGITQKLQATSLQPQVVRFSFKTEFPFLLSPTGIFNDGMRRICLDFLAFLCIKTSTRLSWMTASLSSCL